MRPAVGTQDPMKLSAANVISLPKFLEGNPGCSKFKNLFHLRFGQFCPPIFSAKCRNSSSLCVHIANVLGLRAQQQMNRVKAQRIVATVTNLGFSIFKIKSYVTPCAKPMNSVILAAEPNHAISTRANTSRPLPTLGYGIDSPKLIKMGRQVFSRSQLSSDGLQRAFNIDAPRESPSTIMRRAKATPVYPLFASLDCADLHDGIYTLDRRCTQPLDEA